ncbi:MAG: hypothetical protein PHQ20_01175 [Candidatus Moranbacteria bacterium]|jgi:hypothetical protein|nr:hypothetical protein [Candidatus Moranbacteria bacterium]
MQNKEEETKEGAKQGNHIKEVSKADKKVSFAGKRKIISIFIFGLIVGVFLKGWVMRQYVIGFEDYKLEQLHSDYDFAAPEPPEVSSEEGQSDSVQAQPACE